MGYVAKVSLDPFVSKGEILPRSTSDLIKLEASPPGPSTTLKSAPVPAVIVTTPLACSNDVGLSVPIPTLSTVVKFFPTSAQVDYRFLRYKTIILV